MININSYTVVTGDKDNRTMIFAGQNEKLDRCAEVFNEKT
ncbi:hypothetical protein JCM16418A_15800 [Paenibacillus pini]